MSADADRYRATLRMPRTDFPMRADLARREPESLARWAAADLYASLARDRAAAQPYVLHDGPPFANGPLHAGHLVNKVLKDLAVRHALLAGRRATLVPGSRPNRAGFGTPVRRCRKTV